MWESRGEFIASIQVDSPSTLPTTPSILLARDSTRIQASTYLMAWEWLYMDTEVLNFQAAGLACDPALAFSNSSENLRREAPLPVLIRLYISVFISGPD